MTEERKVEVEVTEVAEPEVKVEVNVEAPEEPAKKEDEA